MFNILIKLAILILVSFKKYPQLQHCLAYHGVFHIFGKTADGGTDREHPHVVGAV